MGRLEKNSAEFLKDGIKVVSHSDQQHFMRAGDNTIEGGFRTMIQGLERYCLAFWDLNESEVGDDGYTGRYIEEILHGLRGLESAQGRFDGGTLDKTLCEIAAAHKLEIE